MKCKKCSSELLRVIPDDETGECYWCEKCEDFKGEDGDVARFENVAV